MLEKVDQTDLNNCTRNSWQIPVLLSSFVVLSGDLYKIEVTQMWKCLRKSDILAGMYKLLSVIWTFNLLYEIWSFFKNIHVLQALRLFWTKTVTCGTFLDLQTEGLGIWLLGNLWLRRLESRGTLGERFAAERDQSLVLRRKTWQLSSLLNKNVIKNVIMISRLKGVKKIWKAGNNKRNISSLITLQCT